MDPTDPVEWDDLEPVRPEPECRAFFRRHEDDLAGKSLGGAVSHLYERYHDVYDADQRVPDQGAAFVFAYLVERAGIAAPGGGSGDGDEGGSLPLPSLVDRKPADEVLERRFWEHEEVPWWTAVRCGVHYSLVIFWLWEADVPLMRRNVPDATLSRIEEGPETGDR